MSTYCIFMLLFAWIPIKEVHLFEIRSESICYGNTFSTLLNLECGAGEVILVRQTLAMAKLSSTGCPIELTSFNENRLAENCCMLEDEDCGTVYTGSVYQEYYKRCHGFQHCLSLQASWVDIVDLDCNQTLYLPRTNYMIFTYSCIPTDYIKSPCEGQQTTNNSVYLWNTGYPDEMSAGSDSCSCAAEISCNSTIILTAIDLRFREDTLGICTQSILVKDNGDETVIDCQNNNNFIERTVYTSTSYFIALDIQNTYMGNGGNFWIQISGEDEKAEVTLSCGPSSITQAESNIKPVCGQGEITLSTSSRTASSASTAAASSTTAASTTAASTTAASTTAASTTSASNTTTSTPDSNTNTSITTDPSTVSSPPNSSVDDGHVTLTTNTTVSQGITRGLSTSLTTPVNFSTSSASTIINSTPDTNTNTSITIDPATARSPPNSSVSDSHVTMTTNRKVSQDISGGLSSTLTTDSSQQQTAESSGISAAVLGASIAVLVILLAIVIILLWKRKQIKEKFCPTKVEDEGKDDTTQPEYDTMPSLFMADSTLPLITGPAATSTQFPTPSGHGYVSKKPQLAPLKSAPQPQVDIFHLSSSLRYHLPKLHDIKSETKPTQNNGAKVMNERLVKTVHDVSKPHTDNTEMYSITDEMTKDMKSGGEQLQESKRERRIRKKKKRMIDRLNRIPVSGGRGSVMGFGSSTMRF